MPSPMPLHLVPIVCQSAFAWNCSARQSLNVTSSNVLNTRLPFASVRDARIRTSPPWGQRAATLASGTGIAFVDHWYSGVVLLPTHDSWVPDTALPNTAQLVSLLGSNDGFFKTSSVTV